MSEFSENDGLFRQEVVEAQSRRLHGEVILQQSLPTRIMTAVIAVVVIVAVLWAVIVRYARVETARGVLVPASGYSKIYALRPGVVSALMIKDGDQVRLGQKLAVVRIEMPNANGAVGSREELGSIASQTALAQSQLGLVGERSAEENSRLLGVIDGLNQQLATLKDQANFQEQIVRSLSASFEQVKPVVEKGYISRIDYERRRQTLLSAQEDLSRLEQPGRPYGKERSNERANRP
jgi:membrane fusion protein